MKQNMKRKGNNKVDKFLDLIETQIIEQNLTIAGFARIMEVRRNTIYMWLKGESIMTLEKYYRALDVLGLKEKITKK